MHRAKQRALAWFRRISNMLLKTGQTTAYHVADDGDYEAGIEKRYVVQTAGQYSGNSDIEVAHYAAATISFTAPNTIADAAGGFAGWAVNDRMVIKGSASNDGEVTVTGIGGAPNNLTISAAVNEVAGAMISLYKVTAHSNNVVIDANTRLFWSRYTSNGEAVGSASNGTLNWYDVATVFPLHPAAADLAIVMPGNILRIVGGAAEITCYHEGDLLDCAGFANAVNNLPGYYVVSVTVNGADLDIVLDPGKQVLIAEAAGGARSIGFVTRSIFNYAAGARLGSLAGYADWRVAYDTELLSLREMEAPNGVPDAVAFPGWPVGAVWTSTTRPDNITQGMYVAFSQGDLQRAAKTGLCYIPLVRG